MCTSRYGFTLTSSTVQDGYLVAHDLIIALDLAQDRARGRKTRGLEPTGGCPGLVSSASLTPASHRW